jgi:hypothetical protein
VPRPITSIARRCGRFLKLPPREILTTLHAVLVLTVVELSIRWVALPRLSRILGVRVNLAPAPADVEPLSFSELSPSARRQVRCTRRVADAWPFSRGPCLRRSLVAGHLLRRHDPTLRLGVGGAGETLFAHAWIEIDDRPLENVAGLGVFQDAAIGSTR